MEQINIINKIINWLKEKWPILSISTILLVCIVILLSFFKSCRTDTTYEDLFQKYKENIEEHQKQIKELRSIQENEIKKREEQYQQFIEEMKKIEQNYSNKINEIEKKRLSNKTTIVKMAEKDPNTLTTKIKDTFGIPIAQHN